MSIIMLHLEKQIDSALNFKMEFSSKQQTHSTRCYSMCEIALEIRVQKTLIGSFPSIPVQLSSDNGLFLIFKLV